MTPGGGVLGEDECECVGGSVCVCWGECGYMSVSVGGSVCVSVLGGVCVCWGDCMCVCLEGRSGLQTQGPLDLRVTS